MKEEIIKVVFQHYIPQQLISDFTSLDLDEKLHVNITINRTPKTAYNNFGGLEVSDIIIYIEKHKLETAAEVGIMAGYDLLKEGISLLWKGLSKLAVKMLTAGQNDKDKGKRIMLKVIDDNSIIELTFDGIVDETECKKIIDEAFEFLNVTQTKQAFKQPRYVVGKDKPTIQLVYNKVKNEYEPFDFEKSRQEIRDMEKWADENLSS